MPPRQIIDARFEIVKQIGQGAFGKVYLALDLKNQSHAVALKTEEISERCYMPMEIKICKQLDSCPGFPKLFSSGISSDHSFVYMATDLLGPNLDELHQLCSRRFSLKTTLMLFQQLLVSVEQMHKKKFIHRDLKPKNLMMGLKENSNTLYIIDYNASRSYIDESTGLHIPLVKYSSLVGTYNFVSANGH